MVGSQLCRARCLARFVLKFNGKGIPKAARKFLKEIGRSPRERAAAVAPAIIFRDERQPELSKRNFEIFKTRNMYRDSARN